MPASTGTSIRLALVTRAVPPVDHGGVATEFGVQDKLRRLHPGTSQADGSHRFELDVTAEPSESGPVKYSGPFVHGTPAERFLYLGWRPVGGPVDGWIRRWKIPLAELSGRIADIRPGDRVEGEIGAHGAGQVWLRGIEWKRA